MKKSDPEKPDVPDLPVWKEGERSSWWKHVAAFVSAVGFVGFFSMLLVPMKLHARKGLVTQVMGNARQIGMALFDFDGDYGRFPDLATLREIQEARGQAWDPKDATSNDLFAQLVTSGITTSEEIFYAPVKGATRPDNVITPGRLLAKGECGFAYVSGLSSGGRSEIPLVVTPLIPGTLRFDPVPFKGQAVILRMDQSTVSKPIDASGRVMEGGMDLFDPRQPFWEGKPPVLKWPHLDVPAETGRKRWWIAVAAGSVSAVAAGWFFHRRRHPKKGALE